MVARSPYRRGIVPAILILAVVGYWWLHRRPVKPIAIDYVVDRNVSLWNTLAQVREPIEELHYGDRIEVLREEGATAQVHTASGAVGWLLDSRQMMDSAMWRQGAALLARARTMPVQASGHTKAVTNAHLEPNREGPRIYQFARGTSVVVLARAIAAESGPSGKPGEASAKETSADSESQNSKQEDWLLVLRTAGPVSISPSSSQAKPGEPATMAGPPIAGWVLSQFIETDLPDAVRDYASAADLHIVAWFELNRVPDGAGGVAPQYLVAASRGGQGQACDFTMLRVYTWGTVRKHYETAYVESDLCGRLPIQVTRNSSLWNLVRTLRLEPMSCSRQSCDASRMVYPESPKNTDSCFRPQIGSRINCEQTGKA
jgi:hypothetical protein